MVDARRFIGCVFLLVALVLACNYDRLPRAKHQVPNSSPTPAGSEDSIVDKTRPGAVCEIHGVPLLVDIVPISFGKPDTDSESEQHQLFPNARSSVGGGCGVQGPRRARVSYCPECRKMEIVWRAAHGH